MKCQQARRLMMVYLDSELETHVTDAVSEHLDGCDVCRERFDAEDRLERRTGALLREATMPEEEWESLLDSLGRPVTPWWRWAAAAAVLVAALSLLLKSEPHQDGLLHEMMRAHRALAMGDERADVSAADIVGPEREAIDAFLEQRSLGVLAAAIPSTIEGHPIELVGAREERLLGQPAASVQLRCCGTPTSLFVMRRDRVDALPSEWQKALQKGSAEEDGLRAQSLAGDDVLVTHVWHTGHEPPPLAVFASL